MKNRWKQELRQLGIWIVILALACASALPALADGIEISAEWTEPASGEVPGDGLTIDLIQQDDPQTLDLANDGLSIDLSAEPNSSDVSAASGALDGNLAADDGDDVDAPLADAPDKAEFEAWLEKEKKKAQSADHILGQDGDINADRYTIILPGESVAVVPENAGVTDVDIQTGLMRFGFTIYQLNDPEVQTKWYETDLLPRTGQPKVTKLTEKETSTIPVPYRARQGINEIEDGSILDYTYVSRYVNDTGLPIILEGGEGAFNKWDTAGKMLGMGGSKGTYSFQGTGYIYSQPKLWFIENYYMVDCDFDLEKYKQDDPDAGPLVCSDGKTSWEKAKSPFPFKLYVDGRDHVYEIPNPLMKGHAFYEWRSEEPNRWPWGYLPYREGTRKEDESANFWSELDDEKITIHLNVRDYLNAHSREDARIVSFFRDILLKPSFYTPLSSYILETMTLGFNPMGGKVKDMDYYLCEAESFKNWRRELAVNIGKIVPVRTGYAFKGWCTDPKDPNGTLIRDTKPENADAWQQHGHTELYAVWESKNKISIKKAKVTAIADKTYTGKAIKPSPVVRYNGKKLTKGTDYTVSYANNKNIGKATVTIKGKGKYKDSVKVTFKINPKAVSLASLKAGNGQLTVKWKKATGGAGYQIQYGLKKSFKSAKTVKITKTATVSRVFKKLKSGKTYYVRIRAYKLVGGKTYVSAWSKALSAKVK